MINIYTSSNTNFTNNGDATLVPIYCTQKVNINGVWQVVMEHPYDFEGRWKYIASGAMLKIYTTAVETSSNYQLYRIYSVQTGLHSVYCEALPIAMDAYNDTNVNSLVVTEQTGTELATTLNGLWNKYTITSNISTERSAKYQNTNLIEILNGGDNCFAKLWNGEIKYDNTAISINSRLDSNPPSYNIRLGRDIKDIKYTIDETDVITRMYPVGASGARLNYQEDYEINDGKQYVDSSHINDYPIIHKAYAKTDYLICTIKSDSKDNDAFAMTTVLLGQVISTINSDIMSMLTDFMSNQWLLHKGNIAFVKSILKLTKKKNGISGLSESLKKTVNYLKNDELKKYVDSTIDETLTFISDYEDSEYELTRISSNSTQLASGLTVTKAKDCDAVIFHIDNVYHDIEITKLVGYVYSNNWTREERTVWEGHIVGAGGSIEVDLDVYLDLKVYYTETSGGVATNYSAEFDANGIVFDNYKYILQNEQFDDEPEYVTDEWHRIDGRWRHFGADGIMTSYTDPVEWGWFTDSQLYYGNPRTGFHLSYQWYKIDGEWVWFKANGERRTKKLFIRDFITTFIHVVKDNLETVLKTGEENLYKAFYRRLTAYANEMFTKGVDMPTVTIDVDAMVLNNVVGYEGFATLKLGNGVHVDFGDLEADQRIVGIEYDCVTNRNSKIILGAPSDTITSMINRKADISSGYVGGYGIKIENNLITFTGDGDVAGSSTGAANIDVLPLHSGGTPVADIIVDEQVYHLYGGLKWWIEEETSLYNASKRAVENSDWTCKPSFMYDCDHHGKLWEYRLIGEWGMVARISFHPPFADEHVQPMPIPETEPERYAAGIAMCPNLDAQPQSTLKRIIWQISDVQEQARIHNYWEGDAGYVVKELHCGSQGDRTLYLYYTAIPAVDLDNDVYTWVSRFSDETAFPYIDPNGTDTQETDPTDKNNLWIRELAYTGFFHSEQDFIDNILQAIDYATYTYTSTGMAYDPSNVFENDVVFWGGTVAMQCRNQEVTREDYPFVVYEDGTVKAKEFLYDGEVMVKDVWRYGTSIKNELTGIVDIRDVTDIQYSGASLKNGSTGIVTLTDFVGVHGLYEGAGGLVPKPTVNDNGKFLCSDGTWQTVGQNDFTGATSSTDGVHGLVPAPLIADKDKFLKGDGSWSEVSQNDFTGATASADGTHGFVPAPLSADKDSFLKGDGTWAEVKINNARVIAWKNITPSQYESLSTAEKNNGVIYLVSDNAQGASGFFTAWKSVTSAPSSADNVLYLESEDANGAMSMEIVPTDTIPTESDNNLYFVGE